MAGVGIADSANNTVGGTAADAGNTIANSGFDGIAVSGATSTSNALLGNVYRNNGNLSIDVVDNGPNNTPALGQDVGDADTGPNNLQNFPVLTSAATTGAQVTVYGTLNSNAGRSYRIEFYAAAAADPTGYGEGERYLGFATVTTDASGNASIAATLTAVVAAGEVVSATATDLTTNDTSEFGANVTAVAARTVAGTVYNDLNGNANVGDDAGAAFANATVRLYRDNGDNTPNGADALITTGTTDASGNYAFVVGSGTYWVAVDSKTLAAPGYVGAATIADVWADQTWGDDSTTAGLDVAVRYGGRSVATSDNAAALATSEHLARAVVGAGNVTGVDYGFSFSAIVNTRGDNTDDDASNARLQQGSLRQFLLNSNAIAGVQTSNFSIGGGGLQTITPSGAALPLITDAVNLDATTQDGFVGTPLIELNGTSTAGVDAITIIGAGSSGSTVRGFVINRFANAAAVRLVELRQQRGRRQLHRHERDRDDRAGEPGGRVHPGRRQQPGRRHRPRPTATSSRATRSTASRSSAPVDRQRRAGQLHRHRRRPATADLGNANEGVASPTTRRATRSAARPPAHAT